MVLSLLRDRSGLRLRGNCCCSFRQRRRYVDCTMGWSFPWETDVWSSEHPVYLWKDPWVWEMLIFSDWKEKKNKVPEELMSKKHVFAAHGSLEVLRVFRSIIFARLVVRECASRTISCLSQVPVVGDGRLALQPITNTSCYCSLSVYHLFYKSMLTMHLLIWFATFSWSFQEPTMSRSTVCHRAPWSGVWSWRLRAGDWRNLVF